MFHPFSFVRSFVNHSFIPSVEKSTWLPWTRPWWNCGPTPLLEVSSGPLEHQRPGSWVTSVLSWAWFPGIPGVAGSFGGYFGTATNVTLLPPTGNFHQTRPRMGRCHPKLRGLGWWGWMRAKGVTPGHLLGGPLHRLPPVGRPGAPQRDPVAVWGTVCIWEHWKCWAQRWFVYLGRGSWT